jgi:hypothetical protein
LRHALAAPPRARALAGALCLALAAALAAPLRGRADDALERFESAPLSASGEGRRFAIGLPAGWEVVLRGERTRAIPPRAPSRREPDTFVEVRAIARDEPGLERLLEEKDGLEHWALAIDPRRRVESRERWRIGGAERDVLLLREPRGPAEPERRLALAAVEGSDVRLLLLAAAPSAEWTPLAPVFRQVFESFEVR